jgi:ParB family chromosome partitioning protein
MAQIEYMNADDLVIVGLDTPDDESHPLYDERAMLPVDDNLVKNILFYGIQMPVIVRKEAGTVYVVDGRQRVKAARVAAGRASQAGEYAVRVPVKEARGNDGRMTGIMVSTNEQRQDDDAITRAFKATRLLALVGDIDEVCVAFGRSKTTIKNWLSLSGAHPKVHEAVRSKIVSTQAAVEISKLPRDQQLDALAKLTRGAERVSEAEAKKLRRELMGSTASADTTATAGAGDVAVPTPAPSSQSTPTAKKTTGPGRQAVQQGIKRSWLRKALKTKAAEGLDDDQRKVLEWFAWGKSEAGDWFDDFVFEAEGEM